MHLQYQFWSSSSHPVMPILNNFFNAMSEEKGETSIGQLMTQIRDNNYAGDNLKKYYLKTGAFNQMRKFNSIDGTHKKFQSKWYDLNQTYPIYDNVVKVFTEACSDISNQQHLSYPPGNTSIGRDTEKSNYLDFWQLQSTSIFNMNRIASNHAGKIAGKIRKSLSPQALEYLGTANCF